MTAGHTKEDDAQFENGERCLICYQRTEQEYGRPGACEDCGGDFVLLSEEDEEEERIASRQQSLLALPNKALAGHFMPGMTAVRASEGL